MKMYYIVVDLVARKVVYESRNLQASENYIHYNQESVLFLITISIDKDAPSVIGLDGCAY